jgi:hypothetical protein
MSSPYVRRRRLADELTRLREDHSYSAEKLAEGSRAQPTAHQQADKLPGGAPKAATPSCSQPGFGSRFG